MAAVTPAVRRAEAAAIVVALLVVGYLVGHAPHGGASRPGAVDIGFAQDMAAHHEQAVLMANLALSRGGPTVQGIADSILTDQSQEIGQLRGWLQLWGEPMAMRDDMAMPGMASATQLSTLYTLTGRAFDVLFLQLMIRHHQGGIEMAHDAELHATLATVQAAATAMRVEQVNDLSLMQPLLQADGGEPLPPPA
jgi:uncharacterized protein (DUF305 family)